MDHKVINLNAGNLLWLLYFLALDIRSAVSI